MRNGVDGKMARYARDEREGGVTRHKAGYSRSYNSVSAQDHLDHRRDTARRRHRIGGGASFSPQRLSLVAQ
jgi:hypothetical protein